MVLTAFRDNRRIVEISNHWSDALVDEFPGLTVTEKRKFTKGGSVNSLISATKDRSWPARQSVSHLQEFRCFKLQILRRVDKTS
jgi:hypothetical protein